MRVAKTLPEFIKAPLRNIRQFALSIVFKGDARWCPVCEKHSREFLSYGRIKRKEAKCLHCGSLERHRFVWLYFNSQTDLFTNNENKMLHVAPEPCFQPKLEALLGKKYLSADLMDPKAAVKMDVTDIQFEDQTFDVIYCSHVLEHVQQDRKALREFFRVLRSGGWAILLVPITADKTFEDSTVTNPADRLRVFGQEDHVRRYGPDYIERLKEVGFQVRATKVSDMFGPKEITRMGLNPGSGEIYYCTKP